MKIIIIFLSLLIVVPVWAGDFSCTLKINEESASKSVPMDSVSSIAQSKVIADFGPIKMSGYKCIVSTDIQAEAVTLHLRAYDLVTIGQPLISHSDIRIPSVDAKIAISTTARGRGRDKVFCECRVK